jgi:hypothetical protein
MAFDAAASIFFIAFLAFIAIAPQEAIQVFLMLVWGGTLLSVIWTLARTLFRPQ